jgi:hypothetical protein
MTPSSAPPASTTGPPSNDSNRPSIRTANWRFLQELLAQRATISGDVIAVGAHTWAIHGSISVNGEVIMAEYDNPDQARLVLGELAALDEQETT